MDYSILLSQVLSFSFTDAGRRPSAKFQFAPDFSTAWPASCFFFRTSANDLPIPQAGVEMATGDPLSDSGFDETLDLSSALMSSETVVAVAEAFDGGPPVTAEAFFDSFPLALCDCTRTRKVNFNRGHEGE